MSSPHAARVAALVKEMHPKWGPAAVKAAVQRSAQHLDCPPDWEPLNDHQNPVTEIETRRYEMSVDLIRIDLRDADLSEADLNGANLSKATLTRVKVTDEELAQAHHRFVLAQQLDHIDFLIVSLLSVVSR
jgi:hypothetical protein